MIAFLRQHMVATVILISVGCAIGTATQTYFVTQPLSAQYQELNRAHDALFAENAQLKADSVLLNSEIAFSHNVIIYGAVGAGVLIVFLFGCIIMLNRIAKEQATVLLSEGLEFVNNKWQRPEVKTIPISESKSAGNVPKSELKIINHNIS
jgi:hypothetical protein